ncbi:toll-like receptor 9 [Diretmus argenteus]
MLGKVTNSLRTFPEGLFRPLRKLQRSDLSDNLLSYAIRNGTFFTELTGLTRISLIYNYEPKRTFDKLILSPHLGNVSGLRYLLLSGNFFHTLSIQSFEVLSKLHNLKKLELRMNFINACNTSALRRLPSLTKVDLSQNMLSFRPSCSSPSSEYVSQQSSQDQNFHGFSDPPLMLIDRKVTRDDLREPNETNLEMLKDNVSQIPTIWNFKNHYCQNNLTFDLSQNDILFINPAVFVGMEKAVCLDLSYNYMSRNLNGSRFGNS